MTETIADMQARIDQMNREVRERSAAQEAALTIDEVRAQRDAVLTEMSRLLAVPDDQREKFDCFVKRKLASALYQECESLRAERDEAWAQLHSAHQLLDLSDTCCREAQRERDEALHGAHMARMGELHAGEAADEALATLRRTYALILRITQQIDLERLDDKSFQELSDVSYHIRQMGYLVKTEETQC